MSNPTAAMLVIGNEILSGRTKDSNLNYIAGKLAAAGIRLAEARVIPDVEEVIIGAVKDLRQRYSYVFTSGGIGPTHDDITSASVAAAYGQRVSLHAEAKRLLDQFYGDKINPARLRMALLPEHVDELIPNPVSAAPGFRVTNVYVMAGVPNIFQAMADHVIPRLKGGTPIQSRAVSAYLPESTIAQPLGALQAEYPGIDIGSYPQIVNGKVATTIVARGTDEAHLSAIMERVRIMMREQVDEVMEGELKS